jgi:GTPase Era involved in 16S rRNA processing
MKFIAKATQQTANSAAGHGPTVRTTNIRVIGYEHPDLGRFALLDTPGLDEATRRLETVIHDMIVTWLRKKYVVIGFLVARHQSSLQG